jgi:hypothetical protein
LLNTGKVFGFIDAGVLDDTAVRPVGDSARDPALEAFRYKCYGPHLLLGWTGYQAS